MRNFNEYISKKTLQYGAQFNPKNLAIHLVKYFESDERIEVETEYGEIKRGRIGVTTGWKPSFILLPRINSTCSSEILSQKTKVLRVIHS